MSGIAVPRGTILGSTSTISSNLSEGDWKSVEEARCASLVSAYRAAVRLCAPSGDKYLCQQEVDASWDELQSFKTTHPWMRYAMPAVKEQFVSPCHFSCGGSC